MFAALVSVVLAVPYSPVLGEPVDGGWSKGTGAWFSVDVYEDDAGVPGAGVRVQIRPADGGYGALGDTSSNLYSIITTAPMPVEGAGWCWRAFHRNALGQEGPPSPESCFRTDWTAPISPVMGVTTINSSGLISVPYIPGSDALSGVAGHFLRVAPVGVDHWSYYERPMSVASPHLTWLGEGTWRGWLETVDRANVFPDISGAGTPVSITVMANSALPVPQPPVFENTVTNQYGDTLSWSATIPGAQQWVASFCYLDAGCVWHDGFQGRSAALTSRWWVQMEGEGAVVARVAVVLGGSVSRWSAPSQPILVDRTAPGIPTGLTVLPPATASSGFSVVWPLVPPDFVGPVNVLLEETQPDSGTTVTVLDGGATRVALTRDEGRWSYRVAARDIAGNQSDWSGPASGVVDRTGPISPRPVIQSATGSDGGAVIVLTWTTPIDALSAVASIELREFQLDGGTAAIILTGNSTSTQRSVGPGSWWWTMRATDMLGNVGAFGIESATIAVGGAPSILTLGVLGRCGQPLTMNLMGSGAPPLNWRLVTGPPGLTVTGTGTLSWTPPSTFSGEEPVTIGLQNPIASIQRTIPVTISCPTDGGTTDGGMTDGGTTDGGTRDGGTTDAGTMDGGPDGGTIEDGGLIDAGSSDAGASMSDAGSPMDAGAEDAGTTEAPHRTLSVGCGCSTADPTVALFVLLVAMRARRSRTDSDDH